jgi:hypothetical protein
MMDVRYARRPQSDEAATVKQSILDLPVSIRRKLIGQLVNTELSSDAVTLGLPPDEQLTLSLVQTGRCLFVDDRPVKPRKRRKMDSPVRMTDEMVASLPASRKSWDTYYDAVERHLTLRVYPSGWKTWTARFKIGEREVHRKIGTYPEMSLAEARFEALRRNVA